MFPALTNLNLDDDNVTEVCVCVCSCVHASTYLPADVSNLLCPPVVGGGRTLQVVQSDPVVVSPQRSDEQRRKPQDGRSAGHRQIGPTGGPERLPGVCVCVCVSVSVR